MKVVIIIISDRCSNKIYYDECLQHLSRLLEEKFNKVEIISEVIPDDFNQIKNKILHFSSEFSIPLILTTGGTGFSPRDVTPEAVKSVIYKETFGLNMFMMYKSLEITPMAALSRPFCGIRNKSLIITLPGSPKGATENLRHLLPILPHALQLINKSCEINNKEEIMPSNQSTRHSKFNMLSERAAFKMIETEIMFEHCCYIDINDIHFVCYSSQSLYSNINIPSFPTSIKDGYAISYHDRVIGDIYNVICEAKPLFPYNDTLYKISTGSIVPEQFDTIIPVEDTEIVKTDLLGEECQIKILSYPPHKGSDIRRPGNDLKSGNLILSVGDEVGPNNIGLLCLTGNTKIEIFKPPKIAIFSTGDEIVEPTTTELKNGQVRDTNRFTIKFLLRKFGFNTKDIIDMGIVPDNESTLENAFKSSIKAGCDFIITSGGVSMGNKDFIKQVITERLNGKIHFGRVNLKPGMPTTFATIPKFDLTNDKSLNCRNIPVESNLILDVNHDQNKLIDSAPESNSSPILTNNVFVFSLPGNPVSTFVMFHIFVLPALRKFCGDRNYRDALPRLQAIVHQFKNSIYSKNN